MLHFNNSVRYILHSFLQQNLLNIYILFVIRLPQIPFFENRILSQEIDFGTRKSSEGPPAGVDPTTYHTSEPRTAAHVKQIFTAHYCILILMSVADLR